MFSAKEHSGNMVMFISNLIRKESGKQWTAANFTLKQWARRQDGTIQSLTRNEVEKCVTFLLKELNKEIYGSSFRRHRKRLFVVPSIERSGNGRLHVHLLIETPERMTNDANDYHKRIINVWSRLRWSMKEHHIQQIPQNGVLGWLKYILKDLCCDDSVIDLQNLYLGETAGRVAEYG